jgi:Tol biopolymer transport system component
MKWYSIPFLILFIIFFSSCKKNKNPVSNNNNDVIDWEGNYPLVNTACNDSILFSSDRYIGTSYAPSVYIMHKNGSGLHALTNKGFAFGASWSPRRWKIIFIIDSSWGKPSRGLYVMNSNGTNIKRLTPRGEDVFGISAWSPNGNKIAYIEIDTTDQYGRGRVKVMNPDGTNEKTLTNWFGQLHRVTWSPDSRRIIFGGIEYMSRDKLYIINSDGTGLSELFYYWQGCYSPSWSPDGKFVAFCSFALIDSGYYSKIYTYNIDTRDIKMVTSGKTFDDNPTWSSDSKTILFSSSPPGLSLKSSLYSIDKDGSNLIQLTDSLGTDYNVSWYQ